MSEGMELKPDAVVVESGIRIAWVVNRGLMKKHLIVSALIGAITVSIAAKAQQPPPPTAVSYLQQSLAAMTGQSAIQGLTLNGTAELIAGSMDETGSFNASCALTGSSQLQLQLSAASRTENRQISNGTAAGSWVDSQGEKHAMAGHNLLTPESWFCPNITLGRILQSSLTVQFAGNETKNGVSVAHFTIASPATDNSEPSQLIAHLTTTDLFLDPTTLRPVALDFNIHPDSNALIDIPVEIQFSNYTSVNGLWIPFTVEKYVNSTLALKLQVGSASTAAAGSAN
jgi:hypothetical protein